MDRAALDVAFELQIPCGGWCPKGRLAEDGVIPDKYPLRETKSELYEERTRKNIVNSDGTSILVRGHPAGGTAYTIEVALTLGKPLWIVDLSQAFSLDDLVDWLERNSITVLNVAGPRESGAPGIYEEAKKILFQILG